MLISSYAGILGLLYIVLSFAVIRGRRKNKIAYGYGPNNEIAGLVSAHGNFAAYIPLALILLFLLEQKLGAIWMIHLFGSVLIFGRVCHFISLSKLEKTGNFKLRVVGMLCTFMPIVFMSIRLLG